MCRQAQSNYLNRKHVNSDRILNLFDFFQIFRALQLRNDYNIDKKVHFKLLKAKSITEKISRRNQILLKKT